MKALEAFFGGAHKAGVGLVVQSLDAVVFYDNIAGIAHFHEALSSEIRLDAIDRTFSLLSQEVGLLSSVAKLLRSVLHSPLSSDQGSDMHGSCQYGCRPHQQVSFAVTGDSWF